MPQYPEQIIDLLDSRQRHMGQMRVERQEDDLLVGTFVPGPAFPRVEQLFHDFEEAVNAQALPVIDDLDAAIAALGLHLCWPKAREPIAIHDVQIWSDGGMTCRLGGQFTPAADATRRSTSRPPTLQAPKGLTLMRPPVVKRPSSPVSGIVSTFLG